MLLTREGERGGVLMVGVPKGDVDLLVICHKGLVAVHGNRGRGVPVGHGRGAEVTHPDRGGIAVDDALDHVVVPVLAARGEDVEVLKGAGDLGGPAAVRARGLELGALDGDGIAYLLGALLAIGRVVAAEGVNVTSGKESASARSPCSTIFLTVRLPFFDARVLRSRKEPVSPCWTV